MTDKINSFYDRILAVRQTDKRIENVVLGPVESVTSFGPLEFDPAKISKFLLNDIQAIRNKFNTTEVEFFEHIDPKKLLVLLSVCDLNWYSRGDLVKFLEHKLNDIIRDSE